MNANPTPERIDPLEVMNETYALLAGPAADRLEQAIRATADARMKHAGAIGLLCELSTRITDPEDQECLDNAVNGWCELTGWTWQRTLDRVEVFPPEVPA